MTKPILPKENKEDYTYTRVHNDDLKELVRLMFIMDRCVEKGRPISKTVYERYQNLFSSFEDDLHDFSSMLKSDLIASANNYFNAPRLRYNFEIQIRTHDIPTNKGFKSGWTSYTFTNLLIDTFHSGVHLLEQDEPHEFIITSYESIDSFTKRNKKVRALYSHYKISVVVAFMAFNLGYRWSDVLDEAIEQKRQPKPSEFFGSVHGITEILETYPKKKRAIHKM